MKRKLSILRVTIIIASVIIFVGCSSPQEKAQITDSTNENKPVI